MKSNLKVLMEAPNVEVAAFLQENNKQAVLDALQRAYVLIENGSATFETNSTSDSVEILVKPIK